MPRVVVIVPTYNRASLLAQALASVAEQGRRDVGAIVVDDGSTDETPAVVAGLATEWAARGAHLRYVRQSNRGAAAARNRGLDELARHPEAEFVCFLDSDDRLLPGKLDREVALLESHPEAGFTYSDSILHRDETGEETLRRACAAGDPGRLAIEHLLTNEVKVPAVLYRADVARRFRFREDLTHNEDSEAFQRVAIEVPGVYCPVPGAWIRDHGGSKSRQRARLEAAVLRSTVEVLERYPAFHARHRGQAEARVRQLRRRLLRTLLDEGRRAEALTIAEGRLERLLVATGTLALPRRSWNRAVRALGRRRSGRRAA
jgi:glycosyltransferase involved in cell wall biosynthesis